MAVNSLGKTWAASPVDRIAAPLRERVTGALRQAILDFQLKPGQRLVERELVETLGVSRTTVREAIRELSSEGLVTVVPQRGAVVSAPSLDEAEVLYTVRASLESLIVQRFVKRASQSQVMRLLAAVEYFSEVSQSAESVREILNSKDAFYEVLIEGAQSVALQQLVEGIQARVRMLRATSLSAGGRAHESVDELREIAMAVSRRDAETASRLTSEHIASAARTALASLRESTIETSSPDSTLPDGLAPLVGNPV